MASMELITSPIYRIASDSKDDSIDRLRELRQSRLGHSPNKLVERGFVELQIQ